MKELLIILTTILSVTCIHVRIPPASPQIMHSLYSSGITIGHQTSKFWDVYVSSDKIDVLKRIVPKYQHVTSNSVKSYHAGYTSYYALLSFCGKMQHKYPNLATQFVIGKSVENRKLIGLKITSTKNSSTKKIKIKLVGNIHGDEPVGKEALIKFARYLLENYGKNSEITDILDKREIHILPCMNPDGFHRRRRTNARGYDLNRNFPDRFYGQITPMQPETKAIIDWSVREKFNYGLSFHGGELVVNYPFDGNKNHHSGIYTPTKDDAGFKKLALVYAQNNIDMNHSRMFKDGIVNGAKWYVLYGGMQDWNYLVAHTKELTVEVSKIKMPSASTLNSYWLKNKKSLVKFCLYK